MTLSKQLHALGVEPDPAWEQLDVAVYLVDRFGTIRWQNAAAVALTGERRGVPFLELVAPDYRHRANATFTRQMLGVDGAVAVDSVALGPNGERRRVHAYRIPVRSAEDVVGVLGIVQLRDEDAPVRTRAELTPRLHETLRLLAAGLSTDEIATELGVALETARNYIRRLLQALGARSRLEAVLRAQDLGLV